MDLTPAFLEYLDNRAEKKVTPTSPVEPHRISVGVMYLLYMTAHGNITQLLTDLCDIDSSGWAAKVSPKTLRKKVERTMSTIRSRKETIRALSSSDDSFLEYSNQPLEDPFVSINRVPDGNGSKRSKTATILPPLLPGNSGSSTQDDESALADASSTFDYFRPSELPCSSLLPSPSENKEHMIVWYSYIFPLPRCYFHQANPVIFHTNS